MVISEAGLLKFVLRLYPAFESWGKMLSRPFCRPLHCMWMKAPSGLKERTIGFTFILPVGQRLKLFHRKRGNEAIVGLNIIPRYGGVIIHDC